MNTPRNGPVRIKNIGRLPFLCASRSFSVQLLFFGSLHGCPILHPCLWIFSVSRLILKFYVWKTDIVSGRQDQGVWVVSKLCVSAAKRMPVLMGFLWCTTTDYCLLNGCLDWKLSSAENWSKLVTLKGQVLITSNDPPH